MYPAFHQIVASAYKDPDSVKFRAESMPKLDVLCGEANAKNGYGAYGGYKRFVALKSGVVYLEGEGRVRSPDGDTGVDKAIEDMDLDIATLRLQNARFVARNEQAKAGLPQQERLSDSEARELARAAQFNNKYKEQCG